MRCCLRRYRRSLLFLGFPMKPKFLLVRLGAMLILLVFAVSAQAGWTPQAKDAVNRFLKNHPSLDGRDYSVQWTEPRGDLPQCDKFPRVNLQSRDRAWGKIFLSYTSTEQPKGLICCPSTINTAWFQIVIITLKY
jgi:hypothetical protein